MSRLPVRIATSFALALVVSGCYVTSAAPRSRLATRRAPVPLAVLLCDVGADTALATVLDTALFTRVTRDPAAPVDLVASVRRVGGKDRTLLSFGFYLWTLGVIPWVTSGHRDVEVSFRRPAGGAVSCDPPASAGDAARTNMGATPATDRAAAIVAADSTGGLAVRARGGIGSVLGWAALLLQPTPWWSSDNVDINAAPADESLNLVARMRESVSRAVIARAAELQSLARR